MSTTIIKIAVIGSSLLRVPPVAYGGAEKIIQDLCESLAEMGEDVTLIAPIGSYSKGCKVIETITAPERTDVNWAELECSSFNIYKDKLKDFDIIHDHSWFGFPYLVRQDPASKDIKICHTAHGHLSWNPSAVPVYVRPLSIIGISEFMMNEHNKQGFNAKYVYNGINLDSYSFSEHGGERLIFVGRASRLKSPHAAIKVAMETNTPIDLVCGSFVDDKNYLEAIKQQCKDSNGIATLHLDLPHENKLKILQKAKACLIPSNMSEPFGLTSVESLATGCPVIAYDDGALKEIVNSPKIGRICKDYDSFLDAVKKIDTAGYDPLECRKRAEYFSRQRMAERYLKLYQEVIDGKGW